MSGDRPANLQRHFSLYLATQMATSNVAFLVDKWMQGEGKNRKVLLAFQSTVRSLRKLTLRIQFGVLLKTLVLTYGGVFRM